MIYEIKMINLGSESDFKKGKTVQDLVASNRRYRQQAILVFSNAVRRMGIFEVRGSSQGKAF